MIARDERGRRPDGRGGRLPRPACSGSSGAPRASSSRGGAERARGSRRRAARLPPRDARRPRGRLADRAVPGRDRRPPGRDHRAGRPQDGDQRAQLGRAGVHGRLRGLELAHLGELHRRAAQSDRRARAHDRARHRREAVHARGRRGGAVRAAARLAPRGAPLRGRRRADSGSLFDFGLYFLRNHGRNGRYFYLPKLESHLEARLWNDVFTWSRRSGSGCRRARSRRRS